MLLVDWVRLARGRDWFQSKLPFITAAALLLARPVEQPQRVLQMMGTVLLWAAFGYGLNDVTDRSGDARAGKPNRAAAMSPTSWRLFLLLSASGAFGLCLQWAGDAAAPGFLLGGLALAVAYSAPPLRLKERGAWGLTAGAAAQWSLPIMAVSAAEPGGWLRPAAWSLSLLGFAIGIRWMAVHQIQDAPTDRQADVRTYASTGARLEPVIVGAFLSEIGILGVAMLLTWPESLPALIALGVWLCWRTLLRDAPGSIRSGLQGYQEAPLAEYYFLMLPFALAVSRTQASPRFLAIAAMLVLLGAPHLNRMIREWRVSRSSLGR